MEILARNQMSFSGKEVITIYAENEALTVTEQRIYRNAVKTNIFQSNVLYYLL